MWRRGQRGQNLLCQDHFFMMAKRLFLQLPSRHCEGCWLSISGSDLKFPF